MAPWPYALMHGAAAEGFDPNLIIADADLLNTNVPDDFAQSFLEAHHSGIASMRFADLDGMTMKKPGDLITYYGRVFGVNPKFLLALIQKEQSLVTDQTPSVCQIAWAAGYNRKDGSTCDGVQKYRGFVNQIVGAAAFVQYFYDVDGSGGSRSFGFHVGQAGVIDSTPIVPANIATAMLYSYTPHLHGNQMFTNIWSAWFQTTYPDGSALRAPNGTVYLIQGGLKRPFASKSALGSRVNSASIIPVSDDVIQSYQTGVSIKFADYSLVRVPTGGIYLLVGDVKRPIISMKVFRSIGFNIEEVDDVDPADLVSYPDGAAITLASAYPTGALLREKVSGATYWVESGKKHAVLSVELMNADFPSRKPIKVAASTLQEYPTTDPMKFKDGSLITSPGSGGAVFIVSNGLRRPIVSGDVFEKLGYSWSRVIQTNDAAVQVQPLGAVLNYAKVDPSLLGAVLTVATP